MVFLGVWRVDGLRRSDGFTLVEMAFVMILVGLLLTSALTPMGTLQENKYRKSTESLLAEVKESILGYAIVNGRFPCPASNTSSGMEVRDAVTGFCNDEHGLLPSSTLGLSGPYHSVSNVVQDAWGNAIRYSLSSANTWEYATALTLSPPTTNFQICRATACAATDILADNLVAVVVAEGRDLTASALQLENSDGDNNFILANESEDAVTAFDDLVTWITPSTLSIYLLKSGKFE